jgi:predicted porin
MKHRLGTALACAAAGIAGTAHAQKAEPESVVAMYGRVYVMFDVVEAKGGTGADLPRRTRVSDQSSLLGVRGTERLGGGLTAFYQLETGFSPDGASGSFAQRNSGVGLRHERLGSFIMGRWDMPFKQTQVAPVDPFTDLSIADITGSAINQGNFSNREQNVVQYWSPSLAGFDVKLAYSANENRTATTNPHKVGGSIQYGRGEYYIAYAYEKHYDTLDGTVTRGATHTGNGIAGYFRFGLAKLMAQYGVYDGTGLKKQKSFALGLDLLFAQTSHLLVLYQNSKDGGAATLAQQPECDALGIGYRYDFSRRTMFQANYVKVNNKVGRLCNFGAGTLSITNGADPTGFAAGVRHTF